MTLGQILALVFAMLFGVGAAPLAAGIARLPVGNATPLPRLGSLLLCVLAFNLTFFWQELWLVIPKALTPGLHPILFHNNHDWTGDVAHVDLLQGTGAIATLFSGLLFLGVSAASGRLSSTWRLFFFWMAFQGLYQCLTQLLFGAFIPGNDVGRALTYLGLGVGGRTAVGLGAVAAMAGAGALLALTYPAGPALGRSGLDRSFGWQLLLTVLASVALLAPFRLPRNLIELALVPLFVQLVGAGWTVLAASFIRRHALPATVEPVAWRTPAIALALILALFQLVLRPGVAIGW